MILKDILQQKKQDLGQIFEFDLKTTSIFEFDFSVDNQELYSIDLSNTNELDNYVNKKLSESDADIGIGGYMENRLIYKRSSHFGTGENARSIHLGVDIWCPANSPIFAFTDSKIHSFQINDNFGDYGPTIILEHQLENTTFYTLYGHLSLSSLNNLYEGKIIPKGEKFAEIGNKTENGKWPSHLHFQIITDLMGKKGDFFGVCSLKEKEKFKIICPNPNLILNYG
ncbi:MAG: peptidoglycan DD-metalloendopeptidase family protein [Bacteroidales bacterium]|nr:peptidoglycan DD-metalloendopeptidase family protein [Bacteroidales bacterium]